LEGGRLLIEALLLFGVRKSCSRDDGWLKEAGSEFGGDIETDAGV